MKHLFYSLLVFIIMIFSVNTLSAQAIIIDHSCIDLTKIPEQYIHSAKNNLKISYGHTSHGSQIVSGMTYLAGLNSSIYRFNAGEGTLSYSEKGLTGDLGNPDRVTWAQKTRDLLNKSDNDRNMIMWSWCGQASSANEDDINTYLTLMNELENDFPEVTFVYMTGHLDGTGLKGNLHRSNNQIREYCRNNNKILFDFADIESYDPDGNYFFDKNANDNCDYYDNGTKKNWADEWCARNPGKCANCGCAHSKCLNCMMKGKAFWWMLARIEGWNGTGVVSVDDETASAIELKLSPNPATNSLNLYFTTTDETQLSYEIIDMTGIVVIRDALGVYNKGYSPINIEISNLTPGIYLIKLATGTKIITNKFVKLK